MTPPDDTLMTEGRAPDFARVQDLFLAIVDQPEAVREELLARADGAAGAAVVAEVRRLLVSHAGVDAWLEPPSPAAVWLDAAVGAAAASAGVPGLGPLARLGQYRIVREVGRGGMGVVFEAVEAELGRRVALKVLPPQHQLDGRFLERFRREAQVAAGLNHDHIIPVYGAGEADGLHYYAMQFVDGVALDRVIADARTRREAAAMPGGTEPELLDLVRTPGPPGAEAAPTGPPTPTNSSSTPRPTRGRRAYVHQVATLVERAAAAVAHAHAHGVLHRDLKPSNLIVDRAGKVWVGDFGLARLEGSADLTRTGEMLGTLRYMPPEALHGSPDARGDVYALGLVLYELLTLRPAFDAPDRAQLLATVARGMPVRPRRVDPAIPIDLETIVLTAIEPTPAIRYPSALALADDLQAFLAARPIAARPPSALHLLRLAVRRHRAIAATIALALLVIAIGIAVYVRHLGSALAAAELARATATREKGLADAAREDAEFRSYVAGVAAAQAALDLGDAVTARKHLEAAPVHLRAWEWRHVATQVDSSVRTFHLGAGPGNKPNYDPSVDVRFHPDGRRLLAVSDVGIKLLDVESGTELASIPANRQITWRKFVWGPRAESFLLALHDCVEVFSLTPLERTAVIPVSADLRALARDAAGDRCALGLATGQVVLVDVARRTTAVLCGFTSAVVALSFAPDGSTLFVVAGPALYRVGLSDGVVAPLAGFRSTPVRAIAQHAGTLVLSSVDALIGIDVASGDTQWTIPQAGSAYEVAFSPDGRRLAAALGHAGTKVWDLARLTPLHVNSAHGHRATSVAFDPTGRLLATAGRDLTIKIFELDAPPVSATVPAHVRDYTLVASGDGVWLHTRGGRDGQSVLWDARTLEPVAIDLDSDWRVAEFTPEGELMVAPKVADPPCLLVLTVPDLRLVARSLVMPMTVDMLRFARAGDALLVAGREADVARLDWPSGEQVWRVPHQFRMFELSRDGRLLAGARARQLTLVDAHTGQVRWHRDLTAHTDNVRALTFFAEGTRLATVSLDRSLCLWDVATGTCMARLIGHAQGIQSVDSSPDGTRLLTAARDGIVKLWDPAHGAEVFSARAGVNWTHARFDADGRRILIWSAVGRLGYLASEPSELARELTRSRRACAAEVEALSEGLIADHGDDVPAALFALAAMPELAPEIREGVARRLRCLPGEARWVAQRIWRTVVTTTSSPAQFDRARTHLALLATGIPQAETRVLIGALTLRRGDPSAAIRTLTIGDFGQLDARVAQTRLAFLALARAVSKDRGAAQAALAELDADVAARAAHLPKEFSAEVAAAVRGGGR